MKHSLKIITLLLLITAPALSQRLTPEKYFQQGQEEFARGDFARAVASYDMCLSERPSFAEAYSARAVAKEQLNDFQGALTDYSILVELQPENFDARLGRANTLFRLERYEAAREDYLKALALPKGETNTVYFQRSPSASGTMQITTAQSNFDPTIYNYVGLTELKLGNHATARQWFDAAIKENPREADFYSNRGILFKAMNDESAARADFEKALKLSPGHTAALSGLASLQDNDPNKSKQYLDEAIASDSTKLYPLLERAYQRMQDGEFRLAVTDYNTALKLEARNPEIWLNRGYSKERLNDLNGAYSDYTTALRLNEGFAKAWLNRGNVLQKQGRLPEAIEDYSTAIAYDPEYGAAYYNRAVVYQKQKEIRKACADVQRARSLGVAIDKKLEDNVCD
jgi:tetratricopeptide (TPR) repeat protein